jgi:hypothetical protein
MNFFSGDENESIWPNCSSSQWRASVEQWVEWEGIYFLLVDMKKDKMAYVHLHW